MPNLPPILMLCLVVTGALTGCPPEVAPSDEQTSSPAVALLNAVDASLRLLDSGDTQAALQAVVDLLAAKPDVVAAGISERFGCSWARLSNGTMIIVRAQLGEPATSVAARTIQAPPGGLTAEGAARKTTWDNQMLATQRTEMPSGSVRLVGCYTTANIWDLVADTLRYSHYPVPAIPNPTPGQGGTVESLTDAADIGIFYMKTLGGGGRPADDAEETFSLMTSTDVTAATEQQYRGHLQDGSLTLMNMPDGSGGRLHRFGMTPKFIRDHVRFSKDSIVYMDAGDSFDDGMRQAFLDSGASVYVGWTGCPRSAVAFEAAQSMFRGMCVDYAQVQDAPNRPFDYASVYADLSRQRKTVDTNPIGGSIVPAGGSGTEDVPVARLQVAEGSGGFSILTPSIAYLKVDENPADPAVNGAVLYIHGSFGSDPGPGQRKSMIRQVDSNSSTGDSLRILSWQPTQVACELPDGAMHHGYVVVVSRDQVSNSVPLTEWYLPVHVYYQTSDGLTDDADLTIHLRFDVHGYRRYYGENPYPPTPPLTEYDTANGFAADSSGSWTSGGLSIIALSWVSWAGGGPLRYSLTGDGSSILGTARLWYDQALWPANPKPPLHIKLTLALSINGKTQSWGDWDAVNGYGPPKDTYPWPFVTGGNWQYLDLELDDAYNIKAGVSGPISWEFAEPLFAPNSTTMR